MDILIIYLDAWLEFGLPVGIILLLRLASALVQYINCLANCHDFHQECFQKGHQHWKRVPYTSCTSNDCFCTPTNLTENEIFGIKTNFVAGVQIDGQRLAIT